MLVLARVGWLGWPVCVLVFLKPLRQLARRRTEHGTRKRNTIKVCTDPGNPVCLLSLARVKISKWGTVMSGVKKRGDNFLVSKNKKKH